MDISLDSLIPFENLKTDVDNIFRIVEKNGKVILLRNNQPAYMIIKYDANKVLPEKLISKNAKNYKLQEAMKIVLLEAQNKTMHAAVLADEIYNSRLYLMKNGSKAEYNQIRARCSHYPHLFETLPGNYIKLKEEDVSK
jgi:antitoxin Phd